MGKKVKCPRLFCGSKDCIPVATRKGYKTGKGIAGGLIGAAALGPVGAVAGLAAGANGRKAVTFKCMKCGKTFTTKV